jgi:hypothetical protein
LRSLDPAGLGGVFYLQGLGVPIVFNATDLKMGNAWPVIEYVGDSHKANVPFSGLDGQRLNFHENDILFYGNSLKWHRGMIDRDPLTAHAEDTEFRSLVLSVCRYDFRLNKRDGPARYHVSIFTNRQFDHSLPATARFTRELAYTYVVNPHDLQHQIERTSLASTRGQHE